MAKRDASVICLDTTDQSNLSSSSCIIIHDSSEEEKEVVPELPKELPKELSKEEKTTTSRRPIAVVRSTTYMYKKRERDAIIPDPNAENIKPSEMKLPGTPSELECKRRRIGDKPLASTPLAGSAVAPTPSTVTPLAVRYERIRADLSATKKVQKKQDSDLMNLQEKFKIFQEVSASRRQRDEEEERKAAMVPLEVKTNERDDLLRPVIIDASNVAMSHGNHKLFSCKGIALCIQHFQQRGHKDISAMVPLHRRTARYPPIKDAHILDDLESKGLLSFTPSRNLDGRRLTPYDDRMMLQLAGRNGGVVVSNDNYRDLMNESAQFKHIIANRLIMYTFVGDTFLVPEDPHGRNGPILDEILRWPQKAPLPSMVHSAVCNPNRRTALQQLRFNLFNRFKK